LKTEGSISEFKSEFMENMKQAVKGLKKVNDRDYRNSVEKYLYKLNEVMGISEDEMKFPLS